MRKLMLAAALPLALGACVSPAGTSMVGLLAGTGGTAVASKVAKSSLGTTALSVACQNAPAILDRYAATAFPAAAPFIPTAESYFGQFCKGALPNGTSTTTAAARLNLAFALVLGSGLMDR